VSFHSSRRGRPNGSNSTRWRRSETSAIRGSSPASHSSSSTSAPIAVRNRHPAVAPERLHGDLDAERALAALVLGGVDHADDAPDERLVEARLDDLLPGAV